MITLNSLGRMPKREDDFKLAEKVDCHRPPAKDWKKGDNSKRTGKVSEEWDGSHKLLDNKEKGEYLQTHP